MSNVLIVEDDLLIRNLHAVSLRDEGLEVFEASDAAEALADFGGREMDLVLLDIRLENTDVRALLSDLQHRYPRSKTIVCSCHPVDVQKEMIPSAAAYFDKMDGCSALVSRVRSVLGSSHAS